MPADVGWSDRGLVECAPRELAKRQPSQSGVVAVGEARISTRTTSWSIRQAAVLLSTVGLADTIVVDTPDVVLVCAADRAQDVRAIVDRLAQAKETEYL